MKKVINKLIILGRILSLIIGIYSCKSNSEDLKVIEKTNKISSPAPSPVNELTKTNWELTTSPFATFKKKPTVKFVSAVAFSVSAGNNKYGATYKITPQTGILKLIEFKVTASTYVARTIEEEVFINKLKNVKSFLIKTGKSELEIYQGNGLSTQPMVFKRIAN